MEIEPDLHSLDHVLPADQRFPKCVPAAKYWFHSMVCQEVSEMWGVHVITPTKQTKGLR